MKGQTCIPSKLFINFVVIAWCGMATCLPNWHTFPSQAAGHSHLKASSSSMQVPPFWQGAEAHSSISESNKYFNISSDNAILHVKSKNKHWRYFRFNTMFLGKGSGYCVVRKVHKASFYSLKFHKESSSSVVRRQPAALLIAPFVWKWQLSRSMSDPLEPDLRRTSAFSLDWWRGDGR